MSPFNHSKRGSISNVAAAFANGLKQGTWTFRGNGFDARVRTDQGARSRIEDAWCVELDARLGEEPRAVFAVFDGLGGEPKGDVAAEAAATSLPKILPGCRGADEVLGRLNDVVLTRGGFTTAVVALVDPRSDRVDIAHVGDSGAFVVREGQVRLVTERDASANGSITDFLGNTRLRGHVSKLSMPSDAALVLCTDGVDGIVGVGSLARVLSADGMGVEAALAELYAEIHSLGAPDNATVVWVRRTGTAASV